MKWTRKDIGPATWCLGAIVYLVIGGRSIFSSDAPSEGDSAFIILGFFVLLAWGFIGEAMEKDE